jgi:radical SAM superfamily enzyme YgiQ (UPF0313 family)
VNGSFVFGMDDDDKSVFDRTVEWAIRQGIETATFHILTPYPGTALYDRLSTANRITTRNWDWYDTRQAVFQPANLTAEALEAGYWRANREFYRWGSIFRSAGATHHWSQRIRHLAYSGGWKKLEPLWALIVGAGALPLMMPVLEAVIGGSVAESRPTDKVVEPILG